MSLKEYFKKKFEKPHFKFWVIFGVIKLVILVLLIVFLVGLYKRV